MIEQIKKHIQKREEEELKSLIVEQPEILDLQDEKGSSVIMLIAYNGLNTALAQASELKTSLSFYEAVSCGEFQQIETAVKADKGLANSYSEDGFTALALAAFFNQNKIAKLLLEKGADPNLAARNPSKVNALHAAVAKENYELCEQLIQYGAAVNAPQVQNVTPLHSAVHRGNMELTKLLVNKGAAIDAEMENGDTAQIIAERDGHLEIMNYLKNAQ